jgi:integrase
MKTKKTMPTTIQLKHLLSMPCRIPELKPALILVANTGLRRVEIQNLKWSNIIDTPDGKHLISFLIELSCERFRHFIRPIIRQQLGDRLSNDSYVFPALNKLSYYHINIYCEEWGKVIGLEDFTLNEVRRAYLSCEVLKPSNNEVIPF